LSGARVEMLISWLYGCVAAVTVWGGGAKPPSL